MTDWLTVARGDAPLIVAMPHTGTAIPEDVAAGFVSTELALRDTDWNIDRLYAFAADMGATIVRTPVSRCVIDVNRDPSGASLYPGQATTELCPTTSFDGRPLYRDGAGPDMAEIERRRDAWFWPYHHALSDEIERLIGLHRRVVLYDAHSIRSRVARLFPDTLPVFNIGTNGGTSCGHDLTRAIERACAASGLPQVTDGRFRGGWTTRHYGAPHLGVHAVQMELAQRGYMDEDAPDPAAWNPDRAAPMQSVLRDVLAACLTFAKDKP